VSHPPLATDAMVSHRGSRRPAAWAYPAAMDATSQIAIAAALAWGSGLRLYAVLFLVGVAQRWGVLELPATFELLAHPWVMAATGFLLLSEFAADKIAFVDTLSDAVQTFVRIPGGALLAWGVFAEDAAAAQLAAALLGGTIASGTHLAKAGTRVLINHSPEPFSNVGASASEDGLLLFGLWLALVYPWLFLALLALFLLAVAWLLPKLVRGLASAWRAMRQTAPP
jgi:hypothetical protein